MKNGKKITLATVKSFIKSNRENLFINVKRTYDGSIDGEVSKNDGFKPATETTDHLENTLGINGAWFVGSSRDYFQAIEENGFEGIRVSNACGCFIIAIQAKEAEAIVPVIDEDDDEMEISLDIVINSNLNDSLIEMNYNSELAATRIRFVKYLINRFSDMNIKIQPNKIFAEFQTMFFSEKAA